MMHIHIARLLFLAVLMQLTCPAFAEIVPESGGHGSVYFGKYEPKEPKSLADIPQPVAAKLIEHLKKRLGEAQYAHLKFAGGQVINAKELRKKEPNSRDYQWEIPAYILQFDFELPGIPKVIFPAEISLRSDASIIEEINLPAYATSTEKQVFHSFKELMGVVAKKGFHEKNMAYKLEYNENEVLVKKSMFEKNMTVMLEYDKELDTLAWRYTKILSDNGYSTQMESILVNAYSGKIIRTTKSRAIR
ncbi:hypothetical protein [Undibacterium sp. Tian12W]|uniref:hypothetical protein n=1 Tax=Undibacterium sp. Tian12W TaxID=3413054 RepID=UPI003BF20AE0